MDFVVTKSKWARANADTTDKGESSLLNFQGNMCCLGFVAVQAGVPKNLLKETADLSELISDKYANHAHSELELFTSLKSFLNKSGDKDSVYDYENSGLSIEAININDNEDTNDKEKIEALTKLFKQYGHKITFK